MRSMIAVLFLGAATALRAFAAPGDLDLGFGSNGYWLPLYEPPSSTQPYANGYADLAVDSQGRIYGIRRFKIDRLLPRGVPDLSFGTDGVLNLPGTIAGTPAVGSYTGLKVGAGDKIYVTAISCNSGTVSTACPYTTLLRFRPDGTEELRKVGGGIVYFTYADGRYFASGARYLENGDPDPSFDPAPSAGLIASDAALAPDGGVVLVRSAGDQFHPRGEVRKLRSDGSVDTSFGTQGVVTFDFAGSSQARYVRVQSDGKIVVAGSIATSTSAGLFVARLLASGALDETFGQGGVAGVDFPALPAGLLIQPDGKIVIGGWANLYFPSVGFVARMEANGRLDLYFADSGVRYLDPTSGTSDAVESIAQASDLSIVVGMLIGAQHNESNSGQFAIAKLMGRDMALSPPFLAVGAPGRTYQQRVSAVGGVAPYAYSIVGGSLPPGLALAGDTISGTPTATGRFAFALQARDADGAALSRPYAITIHNASTLISSYYTSILGRMADAQGQAFWESEVSRMTALGIDPGEVFYVMAGLFFASPEYASRNRQGGDFVTDLYNTFLDRAPDPAGLDYWVGQLQQGKPKPAVVNDFLFSPEFASYTRAIFGNPASRAEVSMVVDFYRGLLGRLPDDGGFDYWVSRFRSAQCAGTVESQADAISGLFVASPEYAARDGARAPDERSLGYVIDLYNAFVRRGGDLAGLQYWRNQIDLAARTREQVRHEFVVSPEFQQRVSAVQSQGCTS